MGKLVDAWVKLASGSEAHDDGDLHHALCRYRPHAAYANARRDRRQKVEGDGKPGVAVIELPLSGVDADLFRIGIAIGQGIEAGAEVEHGGKADVKRDEDRDESHPEIHGKEGRGEHDVHLTDKQALEGLGIIVPLGNGGGLKVDREFEGRKHVDFLDGLRGFFAGLFVDIGTRQGVLCLFPTLFPVFLAFVPSVFDAVVREGLPALRHNPARVAEIAPRGRCHGKLQVPKGVDTHMHGKVRRESLEVRPAKDGNRGGPFEIEFLEVCHRPIDGLHDVVCGIDLCLNRGTLDDELYGADGMAIFLHHLNFVQAIFEQGIFRALLQELALEGCLEDAIRTHGCRGAHQGFL